MTAGDNEVRAVRSRQFDVARDGEVSGRIRTALLDEHTGNGLSRASTCRKGQCKETEQSHAATHAAAHPLVGAVTNWVEYVFRMTPWSSTNGQFPAMA